MLQLAVNHPEGVGKGVLVARNDVVVESTRGVKLLAEGLGFRFNRLSRTIRRSWTEELSGLGLTPPLAAVLRGVTECPGVSVRALARTLSTDPMSAKRCADELEELGLLRSGSAVGDRRPRTLTITPAGRTLVKKVNQRLVVQERFFDTVLSPSERAALDGVLGRLEGAFGIGSELAAPMDAKARVVRGPAKTKSGGQ
jgi:MarR family transcriptional regulator for hemolysin